MLELFYNAEDYQLWCIAIVFLTVFFVFPTFSILRWQFLFKTKAVAWEELKKTFETNGYSLSENATSRKKRDRWQQMPKTAFFHTPFQQLEPYNAFYSIRLSSRLHGSDER